MKLKSQKKGKKTNDLSNEKRIDDPKKLEFYQDMFYLLQTEPRYLAKILYLVQPDQMESFLETTVLTLFGDSFSPREELLLLKLFQKAIEVEMSVIKNVGDFLTVDSVVPKMVVTYNRRKLGLDYLKKILSPILNTIIKRDDLNFELNPTIVYGQLINEKEMKT
jgi:Ras GTPase-activating-like protein IQGAP2/3